MKKILSILATAIITTIMFCGCVEGEQIESENNTKYQVWLNSGSCFVYSFKDEETGVWYISTSEGITPRLNTDGSLFVD